MEVCQLKGTPRQVGLAHGETYRKKIHALAEIRHYLAHTFLRKLSEWEVETLAYQQVEVLKSQPALFEEFCGIARGAHLSLTELAVLTNYTDMRDFSYDPIELERKTEDRSDADGDGGCSLFSYKDEKSFICGQTWDMHASATDHILHLDLEVEGQIPAQILTVNGCVALSGVNAEGVCVFITNLHCAETQMGLMWPALVRVLLNQKSARLAVKAIQSNLPCSGHNYLIADTNEAFNVETTGKQIEVTQAIETGSSGKILHTNHYMGSFQNYEIKGRVNPTSKPRQTTLETYFTPLIQADFNTLRSDILGGKAVDGIDIPPSDTVSYTHLTLPTKRIV